MATKKKSYQSKKQKSKLKVFRDSLLQLKSAIFTKSRRLPGMFSAAFKRGIAKFRSMPRTLCILSIYALTVTLALSVFFWRVNQLRVTEPPPSEPPFDWSVYLPGDLSEPVVGPGEDHEKNQTAESNDPLAGEPADQTVAEPVFMKGDWPVKGELFYGFHETVIQYGPGYPLYYTSKGIAIKADSATPVVASWSGTVVKVVELDKPHGKSVMIEHDNGLVSYYGALQKVSVSVGESVDKGDPLGLVGSGFDAEPDYLYMEVLKDGRVVNPVDYLLF